MTDPVSVTQLLPCPFCGAENPEWVFGGDYVQCGSCLATMPQHDPDVPGAIARWNTRPTPDTRPAAAASVREARMEAIIRDLRATLQRIANDEGDTTTGQACIAAISRSRIGIVTHSEADAPTPDAAASGDDAGLRAALCREFRDASRGFGRAGTAEWEGGPYMSMDDAAGVYADLMLARAASDVGEVFDLDGIKRLWRAGVETGRILQAGEVTRTLAAGRIIDIMAGGNFDWRSRLEDSDFLESADWLTALAYADAALTAQGGAEG